MIAYKLVRKLRDGTYAPLFINKRLRLPFGEWMDSECHPTKGFAVRQGWHTTGAPHAPHLSKNGRVWLKVEIDDYERLERPESQGGLWYLAQRMKIIKEI